MDEPARASHGTESRHGRGRHMGLHRRKDAAFFASTEGFPSGLHSKRLFFCMSGNPESKTSFLDVIWRFGAF